MRSHHGPRSSTRSGLVWRNGPGAYKLQSRSASSPRASVSFETSPNPLRGQIQCLHQRPLVDLVQPLYASTLFPPISGACAWSLNRRASIYEGCQHHLHSCTPLFAHNISNNTHPLPSNSLPNIHSIIIILLLQLRVSAASSTGFSDSYRCLFSESVFAVCLRRTRLFLVPFVCSSSRYQQSRKAYRPYSFFFINHHDCYQGSSFCCGAYPHDPVPRPADNSLYAHLFLFSKAQLTMIACSFR